MSRSLDMTPVGLPHSEIPGSMRACRSPRHIAACHVFHRLSVPRHPPSTLSNLTIKCLDLMRSAVPHIRTRTCFTCISLLLTHIQLSKKALNREDRQCLRAGHGHCGTSPNRLADGGADRDRTDDPLLAKQMLSQLSYSPRRRVAPN